METSAIHVELICQKWTKKVFPETEGLELDVPIVMFLTQVLFLPENLVIYFGDFQ